MSDKPIPKHAAALADDLRLALHRVFRRIRQDAENDPIGLSLQLRLLLSTIGQHPGIGVAELARMEKLRGPTISGHVKQLETAGLVTRAPPDPKDRRRTGLVATPEGERRAEALRRLRTDWLARRLDLLSPAERQAIAAAIPALARLGE